MKDKFPSIVSILLLVIVIGIMSWRDMHPSPVAHKPDMNAASGYYAGGNINLENIPDDSVAVTLLAGEFKRAPGGKMVFTPRGIPVSTFAQRQTNLLIRFDGLPENTEETISKIGSVMTDWKNVGNDIMAVFLDYRPKNPDFRTYASFLEALKKRSAESQAPYHLIPVMDVPWLDDTKKENIRRLAESASFFLLDLRPQDISPELLPKLKTFKYDYEIRLPAGTLPSDLKQGIFKKEGFAAAYVITLDPAKPLPSRERKIGIFPKF